MASAEFKYIKEGDLDLALPRKNNLHFFQAEENFAFFDILLPFYDFKERFCNFYNFY